MSKTEFTLLAIETKTLEKLFKISDEMNSQDVRCTATPHIFQVRVDEHVAAWDGCGTSRWIDSDGHLLSDSSIEEIITEILYEQSGDEDLAKKAFLNMDEDTRKSALERAGMVLRDVNKSKVYENCFFTESACKNHIQNQKHKLQNPVDYLSYLPENTEMELVQGFIKSLRVNVWKGDPPLEYDIKPLPREMPKHDWALDGESVAYHCNRCGEIATIENQEGFCSY